MKTKYLFITITLFFVFFSNAQSSTKNQQKPLLSIYTFSSLSKNSISNLSKTLNLKSIRFTRVNYFNPNFNEFPFYFEDLSKNPSDFAYDFKRYQDRLLPREFLVENNPTLWNLQCPNPLSVQPLE